MSGTKSKSGSASWLLSSKVQKDDVVRFRVSAAQKASWEKALGKLGVGDLSSFYRGAVEAAIVMSERASDPAWQKFLRDIQAASRKRFGAPAALHGAKDYEYAGRGVKSVPATEVFKNRK